MTGRHPKPTALKLLTGNPGKRALPDAEPRPPVAAPVKPPWMTDRIAICAWKELAPLLEGMKIVTEADRKGLELLCDAYAEWRRARAVVQTEGMTYETENSTGGAVIKPRPEVCIASNAWLRVSRMLQEFGLTPAARARVKVEKPAEVDPMEEFLSRRGG